MRQRNEIWWLRAFIVAVWITMSVIGGWNTDQSRKEPPFRAWVQAKKVVAPHLARPQTAQLRKPGDGVEVQKWDGTDFRVSGYVVSEDYRGTKIRRRFVCVLHPVGEDRWETRSLSLDDTVLIPAKTGGDDSHQ